MTDLFEVMGLGDVAIKFVDGCAMVAYLGEVEKGEDGEYIPIHERVFTSLDDLSAWLKSYASKRFEKGSEEVERQMNRKGRKQP